MAIAVSTAFPGPNLANPPTKLKRAEAFEIRGVNKLKKFCAR